MSSERYYTQAECHLASLHGKIRKKFGIFQKMPIIKQQLERLIAITAALKNNEHLTRDGLVLAVERKLGIVCSVRTIQRDLDYLRLERKAPIRFDQVRRGYYLSHRGWQLEAPATDEDEMLALALGSRLAEDILPPPLNSRLTQVFDNRLSSNSPDCLDNAYLRSLLVSSGLKVRIIPEVFMTVFEGWKNALAVDIEYRAPTRSPVNRLVEPHALAFRDGAWFTKAYCVDGGSFRTYALHRITSAMPTCKTFERNLEIEREIREGGLFAFRTHQNVVITCSAEIRCYVEEQPLAPGQTIEPLEDDSFKLMLPVAKEDELIRWVMAQVGKARVESPTELATKIRQAGEAIAQGRLVATC